MATTLRTSAEARSPGLLELVLAVGVLGAAFFLESCSVGYIFHVGTGQLHIVCGSEKIESVLKDPGVPEADKEKIRLVQEAKAFGEEDLGLSPSKNYTRFYRVERPPVAYNLTVSPGFELEAYTWCFPIAGCLPYKGFFTAERAEQESRRMEERGYDTYVRPVGAYSTLGWFRDPIFSTMLKYPDTALVEVVLHEMVHGTIFFKDQGAFNEGVATFVGVKGAEAFFRQRGGLRPAQREAMERKQEAKRLFQKTMFDLADRLRAHYDSDRSEEEKLAGRAAIFQDAKQSLRRALEALGSDLYQGILRAEWNNAFVVSYLTYHEDPALWEALFERFDSDLAAMVSWLKGLRGGEDAMNRIEQWLEQSEKDSDH